MSGARWGERYGALLAEGIRREAPATMRAARRLAAQIERERRFRTPAQFRLGRVKWRAWRLGDPGRPAGYTGGIFVDEQLLVSASWWRR